MQCSLDKIERRLLHRIECLFFNAYGGQDNDYYFTYHTLVHVSLNMLPIPIGYKLVDDVM